MPFLLFTSVILNRVIAAFSWMLIHSLWQGIMLAFITGILLMGTKRWPAAARYNMVLVLFAGFLIISIFTFLWELNNVYSGNTNNAFAIISAADIPGVLFYSMEIMRQLLNKISLYCTEHAAFIAMIWFVLFATRVIKLQGAFIYNSQIKSRQIIQPDLYWRNRMNGLCSLLSIRKAVVLLESGYMKVPVVIGHLKPVILMPLGLLSSLPGEQVEAILLHELGHIRRSDYLVNIFQHIIETVYFFNPAVLWISSWLKEERENCCDDIALAQTQNKEGLVKALISFKEHELYGSFHATAFPGKKYHLLRRVGRIVGNDNTTAALPLKIFYGGSFILLLAAASAIILSQSTRPEVSENFKAKGNLSQNVIKPVIDVSVVLNPNRHKEIKSVVGTEGQTVFANKQPDEKREAGTARQNAFARDHLDEKKAIFFRDAHMDAVNKEQAMKDETNAKVDAQKALIDQQNAMIDEQMAQKDQKQAILNQFDAKLAQEKALLDQVHANADAGQAQINEEKALRNKKEAEKIKLQTQSLQ